MKKARELFAVVSVCFLGAGYLLSQSAYFFGNPSAYAAKMDSPSIKAVAALLLAGAVLLCLLDDPKGASE